VIRRRDVQQAFIDADESAAFIPGAMYKVFCVEDGGSKSPLHGGATSQKTVIFTITATTTSRLIQFNVFAIIPIQVSFPKHPNQPWGPNSLLFNRNRGRFPRRSSSQKRKTGHSPPPSIVLPPHATITCTRTTETTNHTRPTSKMQIPEENPLNLGRNLTYTTIRPCPFDLSVCEGIIPSVSWSHKEYQLQKRISTRDMRRLTTGIRSDKCFVKRTS
jgi:hypothetical protein